MTERTIKELKTDALTEVDPEHPLVAYVKYFRGREEEFSYGAFLTEVRDGHFKPITTDADPNTLSVGVTTTDGLHEVVDAGSERLWKDVQPVPATTTYSGVTEESDDKESDLNDADN